MTNSVVSGGFALLLLYLISMYVGAPVAMGLCVVAAFAGWMANIGEDMGSMNMWAAGVIISTFSGAAAGAIVATKVFGF